ncbi:cupin-like domain-containing protein [Mycobacterium sp. NPDC051804]|uniref:cupin-like domain-containing protein n=1 Tax=Mycobacterium sp. NPDC051804 TaxID=3364295 RepID=UPI003794776E
MFDVNATFEVPRLDRPSRQELEERFIVPQRPVIVSGAMEDWPVLERWTNDYLAEKVGTRTIKPSKVTGAGTHIPDPKTGAMATTSEISFAEYIDLIASGAISDGQLYAVQLPIRTALPELWSDVRFPRFVDERKYAAVNLWLGAGNNFTGLHYDYADNFLTQIRGQKQVVLCPPREIARVYPFAFGNVGNNISRVNVASPDTTQYPAWADADRALVELGPGDMLYIPLFWWHAVWGAGENMSINYWWQSNYANYLKHPRQMARYFGSFALGIRGAAGQMAQNVASSAGFQSTR